MISNKNIYSLEKTKKFFQEYPVVLIYQHNNCTVKQRIDLKIKLQQLDSVQTLTIKNSIISKILNERDRNLYVNTDNTPKVEMNSHLQHQFQVEKLFQGPLLVLGCHDTQELKKLCIILNTLPSFIFLGGRIDNEIYTHLDIQKSLEINNDIYYELLNIFNKQLNFQNIVPYNVLFSILHTLHLKME
jgi:ribosomal protein L10